MRESIRVSGLMDSWWCVKPKPLKWSSEWVPRFYSFSIWKQCKTWLCGYAQLLSFRVERRQKTARITEQDKDAQTCLSFSAFSLRMDCTVRETISLWRSMLSCACVLHFESLVRNDKNGVMENERQGWALMHDVIKALPVDTILLFMWQKLLELCVKVLSLLLEYARVAT